MAARLLSTMQGAVLQLIISNPEARNALHPDIYRDGIAALRHAAADHSVRAVVIAGEGEHFCAGGNLNRLLGNRSLRHREDVALRLQLPFQIGAAPVKPVLLTIGSPRLL